MAKNLVPDRNVHARTADGTEVVRYSKSGKYYLEPEHGKRAPLTLPGAVEVAVKILNAGGEVTEPFYADRGVRQDGVVILRRYGGLAFDAAFRRATGTTKVRR